MYYLNKTVAVPFEQAEEKIREKLKEVGFGVLTEIDMQATMKRKLDKDLPKYKILGACNPNFAWNAIQTEEKIGIMLPCNVTLIEKGDKTDVSIMDPVVALGIVNNPEIEPFANEVKALLENALDEL